jgi:hypothetical protein
MNAYARNIAPKYSDQLRATLLRSPICHGYKEIGGPFVPIRPEDRDMLIQRLTYDDQNMVCEACGSTKPKSYYESIGAVTCCQDRKMVPAADLVAQLIKYRQLAEGGGQEMAGDYLDGVAAIVDFLGGAWNERKIRYAKDHNTLPIRQLGADGKVYAFKSELTSALKAPATLPK